MLKLIPRFTYEVAKQWKRTSMRREAFQHIMIQATNIEQDDPQQLRRFVRLLGKRRQGEILEAIFVYDGGIFPPLPPFMEWFNQWGQEAPSYISLTPEGRTAKDLIRVIRRPRRVSFKTDLVLPAPCNMSRLRQRIENQESRITQGWSKRIVLVYEPFGIVLVDYSDAECLASLIDQEGEVEVDYFHDYSDLYQYVYCDGKNFIRTWDGHVIAPVFDVEFAAIFEIGRILLKYKDPNMR